MSNYKIEAVVATRRSAERVAQAATDLMLAISGNEERGTALQYMDEYRDALTRALADANEARKRL